MLKQAGEGDGTDTGGAIERQPKAQIVVRRVHELTCQFRCQVKEKRQYTKTHNTAKKTAAQGGRFSYAANSVRDSVPGPVCAVSDTPPSPARN